MAAMSKYTTIALEQEDKERLDEVAAVYLDDENASYRTIINFLVDEVDNRSDEYEDVLARAIANADEDDVMSAISRVERDKAFVEDLNNEQ